MHVQWAGNSRIFRGPEANKTKYGRLSVRQLRSAKAAYSVQLGIRWWPERRPMAVIQKLTGRVGCGEMSRFSHF